MDYLIQLSVVNDIVMSDGQQDIPRLFSTFQEPGFILPEYEPYLEYDGSKKVLVQPLPDLVVTGLSGITEDDVKILDENAYMYMNLVKDLINQDPDISTLLSKIKFLTRSF